MSTPPKQPVPSYWIIPGPQKDVASPESRQNIRAAAAEHIGVIISEAHRWKIITITIPKTAKDRTLVMHTPELTPWPIDIGVCYVTNDKWRIDGKEDGGHALILMRGAGRPGEPYNNLQITLDETVDEVTSMFAYLPGT